LDGATGSFALDVVLHKLFDPTVKQCCIFGWSITPCVPFLKLSQSFLQIFDLHVEQRIVLVLAGHNLVVWQSIVYAHTSAHWCPSLLGLSPAVSVKNSVGLCNK
jgi:hypothetical protein